MTAEIGRPATTPFSVSKLTSSNLDTLKNTVRKTASTTYKKLSSLFSYDNAKTAASESTNPFYATAAANSLTSVATLASTEKSTPIIKMAKDIVGGSGTAFMTAASCVGIIPLLDFGFNINESISKVYEGTNEHKYGQITEHIAARVGDLTSVASGITGLLGMAASSAGLGIATGALGVIESLGSLGQSRAKIYSYKTKLQHKKALLNKINYNSNDIKLLKAKALNQISNNLNRDPNSAETILWKAIQQSSSLDFNLSEVEGFSTLDPQQKNDVEFQLKIFQQQITVEDNKLVVGLKFKTNDTQLDSPDNIITVLNDLASNEKHRNSDKSILLETKIDAKITDLDIAAEHLINPSDWHDDAVLFMCKEILLGNIVLEKNKDGKIQLKDRDTNKLVDIPESAIADIDSTTFILRNHTDKTLALYKDGNELFGNDSPDNKQKNLSAMSPKEIVAFCKTSHLKQSSLQHEEEIRETTIKAEKKKSKYLTGSAASGVALTAASVVIATGLLSNPVGLGVLAAGSVLAIGAYAATRYAAYLQEGKEIKELTSYISKEIKNSSLEENKKNILINHIQTNPDALVKFIENILAEDFDVALGSLLEDVFNNQTLTSLTLENHNIYSEPKEKQMFAINNQAFTFEQVSSLAYDPNTYIVSDSDMLLKNILKDTFSLETKHLLPGTSLNNFLNLNVPDSEDHDRNAIEDANKKLLDIKLATIFNSWKDKMIYEKPDLFLQHMIHYKMGDPPPKDRREIDTFLSRTDTNLSETLTDDLSNAFGNIGIAINYVAKSQGTFSDFGTPIKSEVSLRSMNSAKYRRNIADDLNSSSGSEPGSSPRSGNDSFFGEE